MPLLPGLWASDHLTAPALPDLSRETETPMSLSPGEKACVWDEDGFCIHCGRIPVGWVFHANRGVIWCSYQNAPETRPVPHRISVRDVERAACVGDRHELWVLENLKGAEE